MKDILIQYCEMRRDDLIREAQADHLARMALPEGEGVIPLAWLGYRMIALGKGLVEVAGAKTDAAQATLTAFRKN